MIVRNVVSKTTATGIPDFKNARGKCEKMKDPEDRRKCLDDVLFDAVGAIRDGIQEMNAKNAEHISLMEGRLTNIIDRGFNKVDERLNGIERRVGMNDVDIGQIKSWVGTIFDRVNSMEPRVKVLEETIKEHFSRKAPGEMHG
jgi:hypothetical protein